MFFCLAVPKTCRSNVLTSKFTTTYHGRINCATAVFTVTCPWLRPEFIRSEKTHLILTVNTCIKIVSSIPRKTSFQAFACAAVSVPCNCHPSIFSYHLQSSKFISGHLHFKLSKNISTINDPLCIAPVQTEKENLGNFIAVTGLGLDYPLTPKLSKPQKIYVCKIKTL